MSMTLEIRENGGVSILDVTGRLTIGEDATKLSETLRHLSSTGHKKILLNLAALTYLDSSGLGVLVSSFASVERSGGQLKLENLTSRVKDLLLITKLYTVFEIFDNEAAAVLSFAGVRASASAAVG